MRIADEAVMRYMPRLLLQITTLLRIMVFLLGPATVALAVPLYSRAAASLGGR
jgi:hypothetical protein